MLHVGNVRTALFTWFFARQRGGAFILRIEDTDLARSERRFEELIYEDLRWLGIDWQEAPDIGGPYGPYRQSERFDLYREYAQRLIDQDRAFWCFCSEEELGKHSEEAKTQGGVLKYPGTCRHLDPAAVRLRRERGDGAVVRLRVRDGKVRFSDIVHGPMEFGTDVISDPILLRSDGSPTYNYAVVIDDALMKITHVIRGDDHLSNTPKQVLIYEALDQALPEFAHLSTILGPDHARLSKRHGATAVVQFREAGYLPEALVNYIALLGWSPVAEGSEVLNVEELVQQFRLDKVNKSPAVFDFTKLNYLNRAHLKTSVKTAGVVSAELGRRGWMPAEQQDRWLATVIDTVLPQVDTVSEISGALERVLEFSLEHRAEIADVVDDAAALEMIRVLQVELSVRPSLDFEEFKRIVGVVKDQTKRKGKALFHPIRAALTGRASGPELDKLIPLVELGAVLFPDRVQSCRRRVQQFLDHYAPHG